MIRYFSLAFCIGIFFSSVIGFGVMPVYCLAGAILIFSFFSRKDSRRFGLLMIFLFCCLGFIFFKVGQRPPGHGIELGAVNWLKTKAETMIHRNFSPVISAVLEAMVLGQKSAFIKPISSQMIKTGTVHILVVSGFNVSLMALVSALLLKMLPLRRGLRFCLIFLSLVVYCLLTGASVPVVRATIIATVFLFSYFVKRKMDIYNSLSAASLLILAFNPKELSNPGFQLSFMSVFSIAFFYPRIKSLLGRDRIKNKLAGFFTDSFLVSFSAWLGTMPLIAWHFKIFCPVTVLANLFIVPLASLITLSGFSLIIAGFIFAPLAGLFASATKLLVILLLGLNSFFASLPWAYFYLQK